MLMRNIGTTGVVDVASIEFDGADPAPVHRGRVDMGDSTDFNVSSYGDSGSPVAYPVDPYKQPIDGGGTGNPIVQILVPAPEGDPPPVVNTAIVLNNGGGTAKKDIDITGVVTLGAIYAAIIYPKKKALGIIPRLGLAGGLAVLYFVLNNIDNKGAAASLQSNE